MKAFDWLRTEVQSINTPGFFVFERCTRQALEDLEEQFAPLPQSYLDFIAEFGNTRLFRDTRNPWHRMKVLAPPRILDVESGATFVQVGYYLNTGYACLKLKNGAFVENGAIYVGEPMPRAKYANSFAEWFLKTFALAKKSFTKVQWSSIARGPIPFDDEEKHIVEAIPLFSFRKVGVSDEGQILIEVHNGSDMLLPFLTVGVLFPDGMTGAIALHVSEIKPGTTGIVEHPGYAGSLDPEKAEIFRLPAPKPEERAYYAEFRGAAPRTQGSE